MNDQQAFYELADKICQPRGDIDRILLSVGAEDSDFIRFNQARVRQTTHVDQTMASIAVVKGQKRNVSSISVGTDLRASVQALQAERERLITELPMVPDDPHLLLPEAVTNTCRDDVSGALPNHAEIIDAALSAASDTDMVGFYAGGPVTRAFGDSRGQRNWHRVRSFHFDWSLYLDVPDATDRAVKTTYAGQTWNPDTLTQKMHQARDQLDPLSRQPVTIEPGSYRAFLTPGAMSEILGGLAWSGFSRKERESGTSSLGLLADGLRAMSPLVNIQEATASGTSPAFTMTGFVRPDQIRLIANGMAAQALVSPRSAAEFSESANADESEYPNSLAMDGGTLAMANAQAALDTGIWISNLWYLNYSDRPACRMTGMTRFATFWVENGNIIAPLKVMRFDDSLLRLFGECLEALTTEVEFMPDPSTWGARHLSSFSAPGAMVSDMRFTL